MGITLEHVVRLKSKAAVVGLIEAAIAAAKARKWKIRRRSKTSPLVAISPHAKCEDIVFDFTESLVSEGFTKTSFAPQQVHVDVVSFLDEIRPHCASLRVNDDSGFAKHRDVSKLAKARKSFSAALNAVSRDVQTPKASIGSSEQTDTLTLPPGFFVGISIDADGKTTLSDELRSRLSAKELAKIEKQITRQSKPRR